MIKKTRLWIKFWLNTLLWISEVLLILFQKFVISKYLASSRYRWCRNFKFILYFIVFFSINFNSSLKIYIHIKCKFCTSLRISSSKNVSVPIFCYVKFFFKLREILCAWSRFIFYQKNMCVWLVIKLWCGYTSKITVY